MEKPNNFDECSHEHLKIENTETREGAIEVWIACRDCPGYWDVDADLDEEIAAVWRERP
jgi:hypothetical protein